MRRRCTLLLISTIVLCFICPGCKYIVKKKLRKLKESIVLAEQYFPAVLVFTMDGCVPCKKAIATLDEADVRYSVIKAGCVNNRVFREYGVKSVPAFFINNHPDGIVRYRTVEALIVEYRKAAQQ